MGKANTPKKKVPFQHGRVSALVPTLCHGLSSATLGLPCFFSPPILVLCTITIFTFSAFYHHPHWDLLAWAVHDSCQNVQMWWEMTDQQPHHIRSQNEETFPAGLHLSVPYNHQFPGKWNIHLLFFFLVVCTLCPWKEGELKKQLTPNCPEMFCLHL